MTKSNKQGATPPSKPVPSPIMFKEQPIRFVRVRGLPWYSAEDICAALGLALDLTLETEIAEQHKLLQVLPTPEGYQTGPVISPIGAWTLTLYRGRSLDYAFQRWVFKETKALQADAFDRERYGPAQCMALRPNGDVPPRPHPRSGRAYERDDLKFLPEYQAFRSRTRTATGLLGGRYAFVEGIA